MPVVPNLLERQLLRLQPQLAPFLDLWGAGLFETLRLASSLGVFDAVKEGPKSSTMIAKEIGADDRGTRMLLDALVAPGYLKHKNGYYSITAFSRSFLSGSSFRMADIFQLYGHLYDFTRKYQEEAIRRGKPPINAFEWFDQYPGVWRLFHSFEMSIAKQVEKDILSKVRLAPSARKLLDLGGGHGLYSIMLCKGHPQLSATVFDSTRPLELAKETIASENMSDRITLREGDFFADDFGSGYDVALLFNITHLFTPEKNLVLLRKVATALNRQGMIVIFDQFLGGEFGKVLRIGHSFYGLLFLVTTGGQLYKLSELSQLLSRSGFIKPVRKPVRKVGSTLVFAVKA